MRCEAARELLEVGRAGSEDRPAPEFAEVEAHLEGCPACRDWTRSVESFDDAVRCAMRDVPVPSDLKQRVLDRLASAEDDARRGRPVAVVRSRRAWLAAGSLAAACLLLVVWMTGGSTRMSVTALEDAARVRFTDRGDAWQIVDGRFVAGVALDATQRQQIQMGSPRPTKLRSVYLAGFLTDELLGQRVGVYCYYFDFAPRPVPALVYVLPKNRFRIDEPISPEPNARDSFGSTDGLVTATWQEGGFVYVMVYRGSPDVLEHAITNPGPLTMASMLSIGHRLR